MADTTGKYSLPLVQAAQAQKHVTVNEALVRLEGFSQLVLAGRGAIVPPAAPEEGEAWAIGPGAVDAWAGAAGKVALFAGGGWLFATPATGWQAFDAATGERLIHDGTDWRANPLALAPSGAATAASIVEGEHVISGGSASEMSTITVPAGAIVLGVTGRVREEITGVAAGGGAITGWRLGVSGSDNRYGQGLSLAAGSWVRGMTGSPLTYWADTPLVLTAEGGDFLSGRIHLAVHLWMLEVPS